MSLLPLVRLANDLDYLGLNREADEVDAILKEAAIWDRLGRFLRQKYERLRRLFRERKRLGGEAAYQDAAGKQFDDLMRRRQAGPPGERLFVWFCHKPSRACSACASRHGRILPMNRWQAEGLPGPGVCLKGSCECDLVPVGPTGAAASDGDIAAGLIGLRENGTLENMNQGFVLEPFFSNYGNL